MRQGANQRNGRKDNKKRKKPTERDTIGEEVKSTTGE